MKTTLKAAVSALSLLVGVATANAQAMQFTRHEMGGGDYIVTLSGEIEPGDSERLHVYLESMGWKYHTRLRLSLNSPGGDVQEAGDISASLALNRLTTTIVAGRAVCFSACFLLFSAGPDKIVGPHAQIGVHSASQNGRETPFSYVETMRIARVAGLQGVPSAIIGKLVSTEPSDITLLTHQDLRSMGVHIVPEFDQFPP